MKETWLGILAIIGIIAAYGLIDASESFDSRESSGTHHESSDNTPRPPMRSRPPMGGRSGMAGSGSGSGRGPMGGRIPMGGSGVGSRRGSMSGSGVGSGRGSMSGSGVGSGRGSMGGSGIGSGSGSMGGSGVGSGRGSMSGSGVGSGRGSMGGSGIGSGSGSMGGSGVGSGRGSISGSGVGSGRGSTGGSDIGSGSGSMGPRMPMGSGGVPTGRRGPISGSGSGYDGKGVIPDSSSSEGDDRSFFPGDGTFNRDGSTNDFTPWFLRRRAFTPSVFPGFALPPFSPSPFFPRSSFGFPFQRPFNPSPWGWNSWNPSPNPWLWGSSRRSSWSPFFGRRWDDSLTDSTYPDFLSLRTPQLPAEQIDADRSGFWGDGSFDSGISRDASRGSSWPWWLDGSRQTPFLSSSRQFDDHGHRRSHPWSGHWGHSEHDSWDHHSSDDGHHWGHRDSPARASPARPESWGGSWSRSIGYDGRNFNDRSSLFEDRSAFNPFNSWFGRQAVSGTVTPPPVTVSTESNPAAPIIDGGDLS